MFNFFKKRIFDDDIRAEIPKFEDGLNKLQKKYANIPGVSERLVKAFEALKLVKSEFELCQKEDDAENKNTHYRNLTLGSLAINRDVKIINILIEYDKDFNRISSI